MYCPLSEMSQQAQGLLDPNTQADPYGKAGQKAPFMLYVISNNHVIKSNTLPSKSLTN